MTATYNDKLRIRDTYKLVINIVDDTGAPIDLSGRTYEASMVFDGSTNRIDFAVDSSLAASGSVIISLSKATTAGLSTGTYYYDFQETVGAETTTLMAGRLEVVEGVTN